MQTMKQAHTHPLPHFSYLRFIRNSSFEVAIYKLSHTCETFILVIINLNKYEVCYYQEAKQLLTGSSEGKIKTILV